VQAKTGNTPGADVARPPDDLLPTLARGARLFDAGRFFEAHEVWEERWLVETDGGRRRLLQGLIQIAAGFHKLGAARAGAAASAARLFARGLAKLDACPALVGELGLGPFCAGVQAYAQESTPARAAVPILGREEWRD
jgi:predicted metal-dependent hydrolase